MNKYVHPVIEQEEIDAVNEVLKSGILSGFRANQEYHLGGKAVQAFEREFREYHGVKYAISFSSATTALHAALVACGVGSGDGVITSPFTFSASASCILMAGAEVVFADIQDDIFNIDPLKVFNSVTPKTKAIIPIHLMGHPADMRGITSVAAQYHLRVIEDAAQAIGAEYRGRKVGTIGDCGIFSFNQSKPISTGEGGMLITNNDEIAEIARVVRNHGEVSTNLKVLGYNYRMGEMEAALGLAQFQKLESRNNRRIELANHLTEALKEIDGLIPPVVYPDCKHVYYTYGVKRKKNKLEFQKRLIERGVYFGLGGQKPLHLYPFYGGRKGQFPVAERMEGEMIFTDILRYPMTIEDVDEMVNIIKEEHEKVHS